MKAVVLRGEIRCGSDHSPLRVLSKLFHANRPILLSCMDDIALASMQDTGANQKPVHPPSNLSLEGMHIVSSRSHNVKDGLLTATGRPA